jgi:hypothetical protein
MKSPPDNIPIQYLDYHDGRMFRNKIIYFEGEQKPSYRGYMHYLVLFSGILIFGLIVLLQSAKTPTATLLAALLMISLIVCYTISTFFHICEYDKETEIFIQKLDHTAVSFAMYFLIVSASFVLPQIYQTVLLVLITGCLSLNLYYIYKTPANMAYQIGIMVIGILFLPIYYFYMTRFEFLCTTIISVFAAIAAYIFFYKINLPFILPEIFGYHEVAHVIEGITQIFGFLMARSIFSRMPIVSTSL